MRVGGYVLPQQAAAVRSILGVVSHQPLLYGDLSAEENLRFYARMYGLAPEARDARIAEVVEAVGLRKRSIDLVQTFSPGMQQRLAIAQAIACHPKVLLLDEPFGALDMHIKKEVHDLVRRLWREVSLTVIMVTHDIAEAEALATRIVSFGRCGGAKGQASQISNDTGSRSSRHSNGESVYLSSHPFSPLSALG